MSREFEMSEIFNQNKELIQHYEVLINAVRKLEGTVQSHIGRRGNNNQVHALATFETDGFLSHFDKQTIDFKGRYAQTVAMDSEEPQDILKLGIGLFIGRYFTNLPEGVDDSLKIISVTGAGQGSYKVIKLYWISANKEYTRMLYTNTIDSGWYDGNFTNVELLNGYQGTLLVRRERLHTLTCVEVIFEITRAEGIASVPFAKLGEGYSNTSNIPITGQAFGTVTDSTLTAPLTFILARNGEMTLFRQTTTQTYNRATGHLMFFR